MSKTFWLTKNEGSTKVCQLAPTLHRKIQTHYNATASTPVASYSPWLLLAQECPDFEKLMGREENNGLQTKERYLSDLNKSLTSYFRLVSEQGKPSPYLPSELCVFTDIAVKQPNAAAFFQRLRSALLESAPWMHQQYECLVKCVIPLRQPPQEGERAGVKGGLSTHAAKGALFFVTFEEAHPELFAQLVIDLAHEIGHQALMVYLACDKLLTTSYEAAVYSGARQTVRPAIRSLHAAAALTYMISAAQAISDSPAFCARSQRYGTAACGELKTQLFKTVQSLEENCHFTELGKMILSEFSQYSLRS